MKKIYILLSALCLFGSVSVKAQYTVFYEGFQFVMNSYTDTLNLAPGNIIDPMCYNNDVDGLLPHSGAGFRGNQWWQTLAYADSNLYTSAGFPDTNIVFTSNSWFDAAGQSDNWFITNNIQLGAHDTLFWKSAPFQTPRYCDGYEVLLSHTNNDISSFTDTLFKAAENTSFPATLPDSTFAPYTFAPASSFIHGFDGTYIEYHNDSMRFRGVLHPFSVPLDAHGNQNVFIAFRHYSYDDNFISIDDILVRGDSTNHSAGIGIVENNSNLGLTVYPNPTKDNTQLKFTLSSETSVLISVYDVTGKLISSENKGSMAEGNHVSNLNTATFAKGFYTVSIVTNGGRTNTKLIVQ